MRLLATEQRDLRSALRSVGIQPSQYAFRKKGGWMHVDLNKQGIAFAFHRKKTTLLIDGKFEDSIRYRIRHDGKIREVASWQAVCASFRIWLARQVAKG
ncbi:MAG: hypothetical protein OEQ53_15760 [Saprospiraceae bacterium]|nr:hypothetical protein [Saprospiraceae bacterium]